MTGTGIRYTMVLWLTLDIDQSVCGMRRRLPADWLEDARGVYRKLLDYNPDNYRYHDVGRGGRREEGGGCTQVDVCLVYRSVPVPGGGGRRVHTG